MFSRKVASKPASSICSRLRPDCIGPASCCLASSSNPKSQPRSGSGDEFPAQILANCHACEKAKFIGQAVLAIKPFADVCETKRQTIPKSSNQIVYCPIRNET